MTPTQSLVLKMLEDAASRGMPCPTNQEIADMLDVNSVSSASHMLKRLEADGKIIIDKFQASRVVKIIATGEVTAMPKNQTPHWRQIPFKPRTKCVRSENPLPLEEPINMVRRDPCWRCGVRGDIGCEHQR